MRTNVVFIMVLLATTIRGSDALPPVGIAVTGLDAPCATFEGVQPGEPLTLIYVDAPQQSAAVRVIREVKDCPALERADVPPPYFELSQPDLEEAPGIAIALRGKHKVIQKRGHSSVELDGHPPREYFRICWSNEGLHLTIWSGPPLTGTKRWHQYFYLGYDVEPTCTDAEVSDP